jgi:hypothetical protein
MMPLEATPTVKRSAAGWAVGAWVGVRDGVLDANLAGVRDGDAVTVWVRVLVALGEDVADGDEVDVVVAVKLGVIEAVGLAVSVALVVALGLGLAVAVSGGVADAVGDGDGCSDRRLATAASSSMRG